MCESVGARGCHRGYGAQLTSLEERLAPDEPDRSGDRFAWTFTRSCWNRERVWRSASATADHPDAGAGSFASPPPLFVEKSAAVTPASAPVVDAVKPATSVGQPLSPTVQTSWLSQYA